MSEATETTSKLVEVPMVVHMPPTSVAKPIGINTPEGERLVRNETLTNTGSSSTTTGVLFINALNTAPITSVSNKDSNGLMRQSFASERPMGSSAPVRTNACPAIIKAHTAISASCPNPENSSMEWNF